MYTFLRQGFEVGAPLAKRCIIVCPTSLVANWANEIKKWCGERLKCLALSESTREKVLCGIADFMHKRREYPVLVIRCVVLIESVMPLGRTFGQSRVLFFSLPPFCFIEAALVTLSRFFSATRRCACTRSASPTPSAATY
jgi:hypothetical protein